MLLSNIFLFLFQFIDSGAEIFILGDSFIGTFYSIFDAESAHMGFVCFDSSSCSKADNTDENLRAKIKTETDLKIVSPPSFTSSPLMSLYSVTTTLNVCFILVGAVAATAFVVLNTKFGMNGISRGRDGVVPDDDRNSSLEELSYEESSSLLGSTATTSSNAEAAVVAGSYGATSPSSSC